MNTNQYYRPGSQEEAVAQANVFSNEDKIYDAYNAWTGLSENLVVDNINEGDVSGGMEKLRENYRRFHENMDWIYPASAPFCGRKEFINESILYHIFRAMPKGSLLHIHDAAGLSIDRFIGLLKRWVYDCNKPPIYIVSKFGGATLPGTLLFNPDAKTAGYCELLGDFLKKDGAEDVIKNLLSFSNTERAEAVTYIWDEFNNIFMRMGNLFDRSDFYYEYHYWMFWELIEDRIEYAEIRCSFTDFTDRPVVPENERAAEDANHFDPFKPWYVANRRIPFLDVLNRAAEDALIDWNKENSKETERKFHFRVILCARRDLDILSRAPSADKILLRMDSAIIMKMTAEYSGMIIGFDLVSEEDRGKKTYTLFSRGIYENVCTAYNDNDNIVKGQQMLRLNPGLAQLRIKMLDLYLHDGESIWAENDNMLDAVVLARHRIGHGFNLIKFPALLERLCPKNALEGIPREPFLEICPISNQMLRYYDDLRAHGAYELIKSGVQCVLGNDDPMILGNPGLSYDFWETYVGMGLTLHEIKCLVFNSYVVERLADDGYPVVNGNDTEYVMDYNNILASFNTDLWGPFIKRAYQILHDNGVIG